MQIYTHVKCAITPLIIIIVSSLKMPLLFTNNTQKKMISSVCLDLVFVLISLYYFGSYFLFQCLLVHASYSGFRLKSDKIHIIFISSESVFSNTSFYHMCRRILILKKLSICRKCGAIHGHTHTPSQI